jgi:tryprostatin B 6-hydroxylase
MAALARPCAIAAGLGVVVHLGYFIRGEHHRMPFRWITRTLQGVTTLTLLCLHFTGYQVVTTLVLTLALTLSFFAGLYGSMTLYRVFFHPLRKFKGPRLAPISNFWHSYTIRKSDNYLVMKRLHEQYGDVIRTGESVPS